MRTIKDCKKYTLSVGMAGSLAVMMAMATPARAASTYTITDLGVLPGGSYSYGNDVNNSGQVTGYSEISSNQGHAFVYDGATMTGLGTLGGTYSVGSGINDSGQVTGSSEISGGQNRAFVYGGGTMTSLGTLLPGAGDSFGNSINNSGQVTGASQSHAFVYDGASTPTLTDLGTLAGGGFSFGHGINNSGQVVGDGQIADYYKRAFVYDGASTSTPALTNLGVLTGGTDSYSGDLSDDGQAVGYSRDSVGADTAFVWDDTDGMRDLNTLIDPSDSLYGVFLLETAYGISDDGRYITGSGTAANGETHAFRLQAMQVSAVPLPASLPLFFSGLAGIGLLRRRKRLARSGGPAHG